MRVKRGVLFVCAVNPLSFIVGRRERARQSRFHCQRVNDIYVSHYMNFAMMGSGDSPMEELNGNFGFREGAPGVLNLLLIENNEKFSCSSRFNSIS